MKAWHGAAAALYSQNWTVPQLAAAFEKSESTVYAVVKKARPDKPARPATDRQRDYIRGMSDVLNVPTRWERPSGEPVGIYDLTFADAEYLIDKLKPHYDEFRDSQREHIFMEMREAHSLDKELA